MPYNYLLFPLPTTALVLEKNAMLLDRPDMARVFDGDSLKLFLSISEYTPRWEGPKSHVRKLSSGNVAVMGKKLYSFDVNTAEGGYLVYQWLDKIATHAAAIAGQYRLVTCQDYVNPRVEDAAQGYSERQGGLFSLEFKGGTMRTNETLTAPRYGQGFSFTFQELEYSRRF